MAPRKQKKTEPTAKVIESAEVLQVESIQPTIGNARPCHEIIVAADYSCRIKTWSMLNLLCTQNLL